MSREKEILKKYNITPDTKYHSYDYLYTKFIEVLEKYGNERFWEGVDKEANGTD